jgi:hypothetical protein
MHQSRYIFLSHSIIVRLIYTSGTFLSHDTLNKEIKIGTVLHNKGILDTNLLKQGLDVASGRNLTIIWQCRRDIPLIVEVLEKK